MDAVALGAGVLIAVALIVVLGLTIMVSRLFKKVEQGKALIVSKVRKVDVTFTGATVVPVLHRAEVMDISVKTIEIARTGREGLICRDNIRADIRITFFVRVNKTTEDVIKVAQAIGTDRASSEQTLQELFNAKFSEALKTVGKQLDFVDLYTKRNDFRDQIIEVIGTDLNGYSLEDAAIDYLTSTVASDAYIDDLIKSGAVPATKGAETKLAGKPNAEFNTDVFKMVSTAPSFAQSWDQAVAPDIAKRLLDNLQKLFLQKMTPKAFVDDMAQAQ